MQFEVPKSRYVRHYLEQVWMRQMCHQPLRKVWWKFTADGLNVIDVTRRSDVKPVKVKGSLANVARHTRVGGSVRRKSRRSDMVTSNSEDAQAGR